MTNYKEILDRYKLIYHEDLSDEIKLKCSERKKVNYILKPLINKGITQKV